MVAWIIYALLSAAFAALVAIFGKAGIKDIDSTLATTVRAVIMAGFLVAVSLLLGKSHLLSSLNSKALTFITLSGVAGAMSWLFYFVALKNGPASGVAALDRLSVVFVVIFAIVFLAEKLTWQTAAGAVLLTAGAILMSIR
ncbi:MAG: EamA family transporter [Candidatus Andersenbacteria bacterium]|nr:EamA family transporter [bacterium]MDZ4225487.1 EamA family transporter [Candidatus Andersenbacteria bacterium]